ncbi:tetratricopeptide repeat protein [Pseudodesulfovibrio tunisiensis]|uniref:tetratricopeptide repeat protein n=1 Tax=Pseudodesulfovibrio tunisiensis TaxID=463192 RepID=UPI001FB4A836|nr:tetratricopeptide repeat protein [Pseudodesulfovibrio tunisiensis]
MLRSGLCLALALALLAGGCSSRRFAPSPAASVADRPLVLDAAQAYEAGDDLRSLEIYKELLAADPDNPVYLNNMGVVLLRNGRVNAALDAFEDASLKDRTNPDYLVNVGFAQVRLGEQDEALAFFDHALQVAPGNARAVYGKGVVYLFMDEPEIALGYFRQSARLDPDHLESVFMKGYALQRNSLWADAIVEYTRYIGSATDPVQTANAYSNRGLCRFQLQDFRGGMADLEDAIRLNDNEAIYFYNRAQGFQMRQEFEKALDDYTRAISRKASFPEAYINRAELNYLLGKEARGCADLKRACDLGVCEPLEKYEAAGKCGK